MDILATIKKQFATGDQMYKSIIFIFSFSLIISTPVLAHHTWAADYDNESFVEIEGTVSSIRWTNPHVRFEVVVNQGHDSEQLWNIAGTSVSNLARMEVTADILTVGDKVRMAGHAARKSDTGMYMVNLLLPDGREAVFSSSASLRWTDDQVGNAANLRGEVTEDDINNRPNSIFAVWTTIVGVPESRLLHPRNTGDYPLTEKALQAIEDYNPETDNPYGNCEAKGGSAIMDAPYPVELIDQGDSILYKIEEYDTQRIIHLTDVHDDSNVEPSLSGYSTGRWQGDTLLITTTKIDYPFLHIGSTPSYIPQSEYAQMQETLRLGSERNRLYYTLTVTDTQMLSEPMVLSKYYLWNPTESVQPYSCDEEGLFN